MAGWAYLAVVLDLFSRKVVAWSIGDAYQRTLRALGIECSMSRASERYDNAVAERFFWSLKHEGTKHDSFADLEAARLSVFKYVETFYYPVRLHQMIGYKSPDQFEAEYAPS